ncbi:signal recognition particle 9 kDa protein isoform X2 [Prunus dulcis]|uniref:signal recognition particle 9 kDa protein isoform X2 n=1 Tax=Prunus dulcis TaxID=3755 RepID=UPI001482F323|nr:signal recognition particle 9 kDa protein isoform X2 [Prunus dulcis]
MVYITSWDEFVDRSVQLFRADPESTRYVMKYRHCDGKLVLKVTDNKERILQKLPGKTRWMHSQPRKEGEGNNSFCWRTVRNFFGLIC